MNGAEYHVTAVRNGGVYGHSKKHCDSAGCAGDEKFLGAIKDFPAEVLAPFGKLNIDWSKVSE